jgi:hypothetical protein
VHLGVALVVSLVLYIGASFLSCVSGTCADTSVSYTLGEYVRRAPRFAGAVGAFGVLYGAATRVAQEALESWLPPTSVARRVSAVLGDAGFVFFTVVLCLPYLSSGPLYVALNLLPSALWGASQFGWSFAFYSVEKPSVAAAIGLATALAIALTLLGLLVAGAFSRLPAPSRGFNHYRAALQTVAMGLGAAGLVGSGVPAVTFEVPYSFIAAAATGSFVIFYAIYLASCAPSGACSSRTEFYSLSQYAREQPPFLGALCALGTLAFLLLRVMQMEAESRRVQTAWRTHAAAAAGWMAFVSTVIFLVSTGIEDDGLYWIHRVFVGVSATLLAAWVALLPPPRERGLVLCVCLAFGAYVIMFGLSVASKVHGFPVFPFPFNHFYSFVESVGLAFVLLAHHAALYG